MPSDESFYLNLAGVYAGDGNRDAARRIIEQLLARDGGNANAKRALRELEVR